MTAKITRIDGDDDEPFDPETPEWRRGFHRMATLSEGLYEAIPRLEKSVEKIGLDAIRVSHASRELGRTVDRLDDRVAQLTEEIKRRPATLTAPPLPPMRPELDSSVSIEKAAERVMKAALEGERRADTTPEALVKRVVDELEVARAGRAAIKAKADRAKDRRAIRVGVAIAVGGAGTIELLRFLATLHH